MLQKFPTETDNIPEENVSTGPKLKVLFLTYYWPPSGGAGVQRCLKFVKYLPAFGIEPTVITVSEKEGAYPVLTKPCKLKFRTMCAFSAPLLPSLSNITRN
jgi:hypothetical protein